MLTGPDDEKVLKGLGLKVAGRYRSKKNRVYLVCDRAGVEMVAKLYSKALTGAREAAVLVAARACGVAVPRVLGRLAPGVLLLEKIEGQNLCDALNETMAPQLTCGLAEWFFTLHTAFAFQGVTLNKGDAILRNFLVDSENRVWGLDFEECSFGDPRSDLGEACASILATDPMFTPEKYLLMRVFADTYAAYAGPGAVGDLDTWTAAALHRFARWRPEQVSLLHAEARRLAGDPGYRKD